MAQTDVKIYVKRVFLESTNEIVISVEHFGTEIFRSSTQQIHFVRGSSQTDRRIIQYTLDWLKFDYQLSFAQKYNEPYYSLPKDIFAPNEKVSESQFAKFDLLYTLSMRKMRKMNSLYELEF